MTMAQKEFEAVMRLTGHKNFKKTPTGKYEVPSLQTRWKYFLLGWELRGTK